eukprot:TRINITY_DN38741_c0_g1_i1.p1 TRINITY_DN38741_c0_g1~~TRINITY_DN38741_c0_g1_i1.p1  ORF type:complete len:573 (-),score=86.69 TRINITY_DN38741_c0_g1_i1:918-2636(-)
MADLNGLKEPLKPQRKKVPRSWVDFLVQFRWIVVVPIVLPISFLFQCNKDFWDWWSARKSFAQKEKEHAANVEKVVQRVRARDPSRDGLVCTARKPWLAVAMRNQDYKRARRFEVDLNDFCQILNIDTVNRIARVEPYVSMGQLSKVTVPLGFALEVVPELDDLTVGGLINGYGIEGSSHIYGLFQDTIDAYEIVVGDGRLIRATKDNEYADLFYAIPWSQGTLGLLVAAEIRMIPVLEYMKLTYTPVTGTLQEIAQAYIDSFVPRDGDQDNPLKVPDFVEGMVYTSTSGVMMTGRYASKQEAKMKGNKINEVGWWWKPWFYQHAASAIEKGEFVEYIPTRQYYHRHTRSLYWEGKLILSFADQLWFRVLLGWMMPPKVSFLKLTQGEAIRNYYHEKHMCQDMLIPIHKIAEVLELSDREYEVYPIWLCPHRLFKTPMRTQVNPEPGYELARRPGDTPDAQMFTDVGIYYAPGPVLRGEEYDGAQAVANMEKWLIENHSFQPQYAVTEMSEREFWKMFDGSLYFKCREKYAAVGTFMSVYYKSKKGKKTEKDVREEEAKIKDTAIVDEEAAM